MYVVDDDLLFLWLVCHKQALDEWMDGGMVVVVHGAAVDARLGGVNVMQHRIGNLQ